MERKHTPGFWSAIEYSVHSDSGRKIIFGGHNTRSADDAEKRANARLIAAAPDLLAACEQAQAEVATLLPRLPDPYARNLRALAEKLRAAIARATDSAR